MKKILRILFIGIALLVFTYVMGPRQEFEPIIDRTVNPLDISLDSLDRYVRVKDLDLPELKPGNASQLIWAEDSMYQTPYALIYLHGFSSSPMESDSVPFVMARKFGMNLYLPLLAGHGSDSPESFKELTSNDLIKSAKEAVAIGNLIGEKVIVMSCSTGGTLSIYLASGNPDLIDGLILYSPNIALKDPRAKFIIGPWGVQMLHTLIGEYYNPKSTIDNPLAGQYWNTTYHTNGLLVLQDLLNQTMIDSVFQDLRQPYFCGFYYKNEQENDSTISVEAIKVFNTMTGTPADQKHIIAFPEVGAHVITNPIKSKNPQAVSDSTALWIQKLIAK